MKYPKVTQLKSGEVYVSFNFNQRRVRLFNGSRLGIDLYPNFAPVEKRLEVGNILAYEVYTKLKNRPHDSSIFEDRSKVKLEFSHKEALQKALTDKQALSSSRHHKNLLKYVCKQLLEELNGNVLTKQSIDAVLSRYTNNTSYNTIRAYILNLCNQASIYGLPTESFKPIPKLRQKEILHKPIQDIQSLLEEIRSYNNILYLCCLFTYGCLLRPHREVRELKWADFSKDLKYISLTGDRNKSGRNRVVPVPEYIRGVLKPDKAHFNVFSGCETPFSRDYFKGLWSRFKKQSRLLEYGQTLYSFRHTGAIDVYKRTGSIEKLKAAMGHSNILVSLTYLRGLDIPDLNVDDMPQLPVLPAPPPPEPPEL